MDKVLLSLDESEPVHGDLDTVLYLIDVHKVVYRNLHTMYIVICFFTFLNIKELIFFILSLYSCSVSILLHQAVFV